MIGSREQHITAMLLCYSAQNLTYYAHLVSSHWSFYALIATYNITCMYVAIARAYAIWQRPQQN